ncbi:MAG: prepilin-type N-terminal cleavage/methylation domain-containing protein [Deltaproteobacteria bacterium]|nr:prepilin-type N-terminal cleavage/methylation domain-containing protein [Deltaproteobacteria bacterium]
MAKRKNGRLASPGGFTLVEMLVSILITSLIVVAIYSIFRVQTHSVKIQENRLEAQEYARSVLDIMVREIRNAGYFPVTVTDLVNCTPTLGGIVTAGAQTFSFNLDADANGNCAGPNERIAYTFSGGNITRAADGGAAESLTDSNATNLQLIYYPQQTGGTAPPPYCYASLGDLIVNGVTCSGIVTANLANIQRVSISVTVQSKNPDAEFGGQLNATMTSNADLRNRGLS